MSSKSILTISSYVVSNLVHFSATLYIVPFPRYSYLLAENCHIFIPYLFTDRLSFSSINQYILWPFWHNTSVW